LKLGEPEVGNGSELELVLMALQTTATYMLSALEENTKIDFAFARKPSNSHQKIFSPFVPFISLNYSSGRK
jgi:hypothetical protein